MSAFTLIIFIALLSATGCIPTPSAPLSDIEQTATAGALIRKMTQEAQQNNPPTPNDQNIPAGLASVTYRITLYTGDVGSAGTDANVYITLYGSQGTSAERALDKSGNDRERGDVDVYSIEMTDLGNLSRVRIRHDNTGVGPGWFLDKITVQNEGSGKTWVFPCNRWLATDEDDGRIDRVLNVQ
jgi:hypothetical protein